MTLSTLFWLALLAVLPIAVFARCQVLSYIAKGADG